MKRRDFLGANMLTLAGGEGPLAAPARPTGNLTRAPQRKVRLFSVFKCSSCGLLTGPQQ